MWLAGFAATSSGVPSATTAPPPDPPSGPRSMIQSTVLITSRLCSMTMTVFPLSTSEWSTPSRRRTSSKCNPWSVRRDVHRATGRASLQLAGEFDAAPLPDSVGAG